MFVSWLRDVPATCRVHPRDGSAETLSIGLVREKLQINLLSLRVATTASVFK